MAKTADGKPDDRTASTCNRSDKKRSTFPSSFLTNKNLAKAQKTKLYPIKFE
jgi:hypothetical protein